MEIVFPVGDSEVRSYPLERFLPPLEGGVVGRIVNDLKNEPTRIFDPFGSSPQLALECALAGCDITLAVNNPITRFVIEHTLKPFSVAELQAALAHLAAIPKDDTRLEPFILGLYQSRCARCGESVDVEYFIWDKELGGPSHKVYACEACAHAGESIATEQDWDTALDYSRNSLQTAFALDSLAPPGDPDRKHAEAALSVYPGRAIFALITILNKLAQVQLEPRALAATQALLLTAFEAANALWSYPEGRTRPRQLIASSRYREFNVWRALERGVDQWAMEDEGVRVEDWISAEGSRSPGVYLYAGSARALCSEAGAMDGMDLILTIPPRPNQAYWTLSALWTAWLWGREEASSIKVALQRRRYDWGWHATAIRTVLRNVSRCYLPTAPAIVFVPEAEPGFVAATMAGVEGAGFRLEGHALRYDEQQFITHWVNDPIQEYAARGRIENQTLRTAMQATLEELGQPTPYSVLHGSAWAQITAHHLLDQDWTSPQRHPLQKVVDQIEEVLQSMPFEHLSRGSEPETGTYDLSRPGHEHDPLLDRVELSILSELRSHQTILQQELDQAICEQFRGLLTPDRRWVNACLRSYAEQVPDSERWRLRSEDHPDLREADCAEMRALLEELGQRLGFKVELDQGILWRRVPGQAAHYFEIRETAAWGHPARDPANDQLTFVVPGGRSGLIAERTRRNPRFKHWLEQGLRVIKFRHVRRLAADTTLTVGNLSERMAIDPPEHEDPQLPLL